jgi:hypothetical protein
VCYSDSAIFALVTLTFFFYSDSLIFRFCPLFLDFVNYFLDFGRTLQRLSHVATMTQSFFRFSQLFLRFHRTIQQLSHFCYNNSVIFEILSNIIEVFVSNFSDFTQPFLKFA